MVRWLNVAIDNVKEKYSNCRSIGPTGLVMRDNTIRTLRGSLNLTRQRYEDILLESSQRWAGALG